MRAGFIDSVSIQPGIGGPPASARPSLLGRRVMLGLGRALSIATIVGSSAAWAAVALDVAPAAVCVTDGAVSIGNDGWFRIDSPSSRAVTREGDDDFAALEFEYLGAPEGTSKLASGDVKRQFGIKLRAQDSCNVVYVMWPIEGGTSLEVVSKLNKGMSKHAECGVKGYAALRPSFIRPVPRLEPGQTHRLEASIERRFLAVRADGDLVWRGDIGPKADLLNGYAGLRTDNVRVRFRWSARSSADAPGQPSPVARPSVVCRPVQ